MKVIVWVHKDDIIIGEIRKHHFHCPQPGYSNYVQVSISVDEFVQLRDKQVEETPTPDIVKKHKTITGGEFPSFWANLSIEEKSQIQKEYGWNY
tara:strand:- start:157 stop:438 length:282 start_codon:yes stop_codon:yes gene_type:complete